MFKTAILTLISALMLAPSPFSALAATTAPQEECNLQTSFDKLISAKDLANVSTTGTSTQLEADAYKALLGEVLRCSRLETENFKTKLESLANLSEKDTKIRDAFLKELADFSLYYDAAEEEEKLKKNGSDIASLKQMALELSNWRQDSYTPNAKQIANFIFIFQGKTVIRTADNRLKKISLALLDAGLLFRRDTWKDFRILLNQAQQHIDDAAKLNQDAYNLFINDLEPAATSTTETALPVTEEPKEEKPTTTELLRQSLTEVKEAYKIFGEIGKIVKKILG